MASNRESYMGKKGSTVNINAINYLVHTDSVSDQFGFANTYVVGTREMVLSMTCRATDLIDKIDIWPICHEETRDLLVNPYICRLWGRKQYNMEES